MVKNKEDVSKPIVLLDPYRMTEVKLRSLAEKNPPPSWDLITAIHDRKADNTRYLKQLILEQYSNFLNPKNQDSPAPQQMQPIENLVARLREVFKRYPSNLDEEHEIAVIRSRYETDLALAKAYQDAMNSDPGTASLPSKRLYRRAKERAKLN